MTQRLFSATVRNLVALEERTLLVLAPTITEAIVKVRRMSDVQWEVVKIKEQAISSEKRLEELDMNKSYIIL